jgi:hypothetical protein
MCKEIGCKTRPSFNFKGEKKALFCATHKQTGMISVTNIICLDCEKHANYNIYGQKQPLYCATHKKDSMVDVTNKKCEYEKCTKIPSFTPFFISNADYL